MTLHRNIVDFRIAGAAQSRCVGSYQVLFVGWTIKNYDHLTNSYLSINAVYVVKSNPLVSCGAIWNFLFFNPIDCFSVKIKTNLKEGQMSNLNPIYKQNQKLGTPYALQSVCMIIRLI